MEAVYGELLDPRDQAFADPAVASEDKARLGAGPRQYKSAQAIYADLMAAEPDATPERAEQLKVQARKQARAAVCSSTSHSARTSPRRCCMPACRQPPCGLSRAGGQRRRRTIRTWGAKSRTLSARERRQLWSTCRTRLVQPGWLSWCGPARRARPPPGRALDRPLRRCTRVGGGVVPAAHQPGRRPAAARPQRDLESGAVRGRHLAHDRLPRHAQSPRGGVGYGRPGDGRADRPASRRRACAAPRRARPGADRGAAAS